MSYPLLSINNHKAGKLYGHVSPKTGVLTQGFLVLILNWKKVPKRLCLLNCKYLKWFTGNESIVGILWLRYAKNNVSPLRKRVRVFGRSVEQNVLFLEYAFITIKRLTH